MGKLAKTIAYALVGIFLFTGGWKLIWNRVAPAGRTPSGAVGPTIAGSAGGDLNSILARHGVTSHGIVNGAGGRTLTVTWQGAGSNAGAQALNEARQRGVIGGWREARAPDLRGSNQNVRAEYVIW